MNEELTFAEMYELIALIHTKYNHDLSGYSEASLRRRFVRAAQMANISVFELKFRITNDESFFPWLLETLTLNVTEMFRDPAFFRELAELILPQLKDSPVIRIWHAGCATGEEAFSMAILLEEAGILSRTKIYATDVNPANLEKAKAGIIPLKKMRQYTTNYLRAGGKSDFSSYYTAQYDHAIIDSRLRKNIYFVQHNLAHDEVFNEFQLICCRNVLIYFKKSLKERVIGLFGNSLSANGYLALGSRESLAGSTFQNKFDTISPLQKIYQRKTDKTFSAIHSSNN